MCAGCPGGRPVSSTTALLNAERLKPAVLAELRRRLGRRAGLSVLGDRWVLRSRTGRQEVFDDVEALAGALRARELAAPASPGAPPGRAAELVESLLASHGPSRAVMGRARTRTGT